MPNPFDSMGLDRNHREDVGWEVVEGTFSCDSRGCFYKAVEALYNSEKQELKFTCTEGHSSLIKGFVL